MNVHVLPDYAFNVRSLGVSTPVLPRKYSGPSAEILQSFRASTEVGSFENDSFDRMRTSVSGISCGGTMLRTR